MIEIFWYALGVKQKNRLSTPPGMTVDILRQNFGLQCCWIYASHFLKIFESEYYLYFSLGISSVAKHILISPEDR